MSSSETTIPCPIIEGLMSVRLTAPDEDHPAIDAAIAEIERLRRGWLRIIQGENGCATTGTPCGAKRCGCVEERELLADD